MSSAPANETGLVVSARGRRGTLETDDRRLSYLIKGRRLHVVCGDRVRWHGEGPDDTVIVDEILIRNNALERQNPGTSRTETLAANLTCMVVVAAPHPKPDWFVVDRYLCIGALMGCRLIVAINKSDEEDADARAACEAEASAYREAGYDCLWLSAISGDGIADLAARLVDNVSILVGQSGVGKTSLINRLVPGLDAAVGQVSSATNEGTHTTAASTMHRLPSGGRLIDSPGVRDFVPKIDAYTGVVTGFPEIAAAGVDCRFDDCRHLREPDCAVKAAVDAGRISPRRYESFRRMSRQTTG